MAEEHKLLELAACLKSTKKRDRTKGLINAATIIKQDDVATHLSKCSRGLASGTTWDIVFSHVHEAVMAETERGGYSAKLLLNMIESLITIVRKADGLIKATTLVSAVLAAFDSDFDVPPDLGKTYFELASAHLLALPKYRAELKSDNFNDLVYSCMRQYTRPRPAGSSIKSLELLSKTVTAGERYSLTLETLLTLLPFFKNILTSDLPPSATFECNLLLAVNTTLRGLVSDARYKVAVFTEETIGSVLRMYKSGSDNNPLIFENLWISLNVHHPQGVGFEHPLFYAHDHDQWKQSLSEILELCEREVCELLRSGDYSLISKEFITLFVDIAHVMSLIRSSTSESPPDEEVDDPVVSCTFRKRKLTDTMVHPTQKRAKLVSATTSLSNVLTDMSPKDYWFWLRYLEVLLKRHPLAVEKDYGKIATFICSLISDVHSSHMDQLVKCADLLLSYESRYNFRDVWITCFEALSRSVGKDNSDELHKLLQILISSGGVKSPAPCLNLFLNKSIPRTAASIQTLADLIKMGSVIPEEDRCCLLRWGLSDCAYPVETSELAMVLLFKNIPAFNPKRAVSVKDFTAVYTVLTLSEEGLDATEEKIGKHPNFIYARVADSLLAIIEEIAMIDNHCDSKDLVQSADRLELILKILSYAWREQRLKTKLLTFIQPLFVKFISNCEEEIRAGNLLRCERLSRLFALDLVPPLQSLLRDGDFTSADFSQLLMDKFRTVTKREYPDQPMALCTPKCTSKFARLVFSLSHPDVENMLKIDNSEHPRLYILDVLCQIGDVDQLITIMTEIGTNLSNLKFRVLLQLIFSISESPEVTHEHLSHCLQILQLMCRERNSDNCALTIILEIIRNMIPTIGDQGHRGTFDNLLTLFDGILSNLTKRRGTVYTLAVKYLELLSETCAYAPLAEYLWEMENISVVETVFKFVNCSSVYVRLAAARAVGKILQFQSSRDIFQNLRRQLAKLENGHDEYTAMAVVSTTLMTMAYAFNASGKTRFIAAYTTVNVIHSQNLSYCLIANYLELLSRLLNVKNASNYFKKHLRDLLYNWITADNHIKDFPYPIVNSKNIVHFYNEFCDVVGGICFVLQKRDMLQEVATMINWSVPAILEKAFPVIACLGKGKLPNELDEYLSLEKQRDIFSREIGKIAYMVLRENPGGWNQEQFNQIISNAQAVQQALLLFEEDLVECVTDEDVIDSLTQYSGFVKRYVEETKSAVNNNINHFVWRDTVSVILRFLSGKYSPEALKLACDLVRSVIDGYGPVLKTEIVDTIPGIVNSLVVISGDAKNQAAQDLLRYLIVEKKHDFPEALARLDPFPDDEFFSGLVDFDENCSLREEMQRFSKVVGHKGRRVGGLARLLRAFESRKQELREIYEEAWNVQGLSEGNLLHDVLLQLVELCAHKDELVRTEAAKCLGELGPTDLNTLVIKWEQSEKSEYVAVQERLVDNALSLLSQVIQTESLDVKKIACKALYGVIRCNGAMSECSMYFAPFCSQNTLTDLVFTAKNHYGPPLGVWLPSLETPHQVWVQQLTMALFDTVRDYDGVSDLLQDMCAAHVPFAQQMLASALGVVVEVGDSVLVENITQCINHFFTNVNLKTLTLEPKSVITLVEAVDYLRRWNFRRGEFGASLNHEKTSCCLDLLAVAEAADKFGAHFIAIMYAELWYEDQKSNFYTKYPDVLHVNVDDLKERRNILSRVMRTGLAKSGVVDGLRGCGLSHLEDPDERIIHLEQMGRWDMSLVMHDAMQKSSGVAKALLQIDLPHTLASLPQFSQDQLTCAAKLGDWNYVVSSAAEPSFQLHHYSALRALHLRDSSSMMDEVSKATSIVLKRMAENNMESPQNLYGSLAHLQCLKQLRDVEFGGSLQHLAEKWRQQDLLKPSEFSLLADVLEVRCVIIKELAEDPDLLAEQHLRLCKLARKAGKNEVALRNILHIRQLIQARQDLLLEGQLEEARYFWGMGVHENATFLLSRLLETLQTTNKSDLYAKCLRTYGKWMVERKTENPQDIIKKYLMTSVEIAKNPKNKLEAYAAMAKFADANYIQLQGYLNSSDFENRKINLQQRMHSVKASQSVGKNVMFAKREGENDLKEVSYLQRDAKSYLTLAVRYYVLSLQIGDKYDHFVFRLISLWLKNSYAMSEDEVAKIPSYKFISLLPQIVPRMHDDPILTQTVERILNDHPYHTFPFLFAVKNSHADQQFTALKIEEPTPRMRAAFVMLKKAAARWPVHINEMDRFTEALIQLAHTPCPKTKPQFVEVSEAAAIRSLKNLTTVLMPSEELPIQRNSQYNNIIGISKFSTTYELVGGVNDPKKIKCEGTDGKSRVLLVKGRDDLRQDAVMQQVFSVINLLLARNEETARHKLVMRTYRVTPLSQLSGIIGWCPNTQPLGLYLVGKNSSGGAHVRFRPDDMKPAMARHTMKNLAKEGPEERLRGFLNICKQFRPVFHYFFLEKFTSAGVAFDRRLAYTRSVATSSMIGYILGLGDRHVQNVLIDNSTAEVIHIDLGVAFDQGKLQNMPETVPFRLTRDIVDGMGLTGVDGVFRSCCNRTMAVLRENMDVIMTLLEVLLYDPLDSWIVPEEPSCSVLEMRGNQTVNNVNVIAERALALVSLKLQGLDKGVVTTVKGQVNGLIQQAMDASNLSRLFAGWQPYI